MFKENTEKARKPSIPLREDTVWVQTGLNELLPDGYITCITCQDCRYRQKK